jgi:hypothetical protein
MRKTCASQASWTCASGTHPNLACTDASSARSFGSPVAGDRRSCTLVGTAGVRNGPATVGRTAETRWMPFSRANANAASSASRFDRM